jgi:pyridoxal phosphate enzyme (YggS family)
VVLGDDVLGKPADDRDAAAMLSRLSGREHEVLTAVAWACDGEVHAADMTRSRVRFRALSDREIADYVATGEPADKAGAYGIQAGASSFVCGVTGSTTGVIGLPLAETEALARRVGVPEPRSPLPAEAVALRWSALRSEVAGLAVACGREARSVRVVAVGKGQPADLVAAAIAAGATDVGENYVQEASAKRADVEASSPPAAAARWHLIGPLQRNKAAAAARTFDLVHTIHRVDVARALAARSPSPPARALVQVNVTGDPAKSGVAPADVSRLVAQLSAVPGLALEGLMTIGPDTDDVAAQRAAFDALAASLRTLRAMGYERLHELSMGMSGDYAAAIAAGATLLRIGTAIFGPRRRPGVSSRATRVGQ